MSIFYIRDFEQNKEQIEKITQIEFFNTYVNGTRKSLFKYFPNTIKMENGVERNFSKESLINNTVFLSSPLNFDDPYDCNIYIDYNEFALQRAQYYSSLCGITVRQEWNYNELLYNLAECVYNHISSGKKIESLFELDNNNDLVYKTQKIFLLSLKVELSKIDADGESYYKAINYVINNEYNNIQETANNVRVACFTQTPYSILMWSHYANNHQGFCIEYEIPSYSEENADIYQNLLPVIYTDTRISLTEFSLNWNKAGTLTEDETWDFYKYCLLCKSIDWKYQQEWRLISLDKKLTDENYNCNFFKIKKVYLGNKMSPKDRLDIIEICKNKGIPYTGVIIAPDQFNMKDCGILCENCYKIKPNT